MPSDLDDRVLGLLRSRATWTAADLAAELEVSLRTVRRALARLSGAGAPLESAPGRGGGVRLAGNAGLRQLRLDHREVLDLLLALAVAESLGSPLLMGSLRTLRQKVGAALPATQRSALRRRILVGAPAGAEVVSSLARPRSAVIGPLQDAFFARQVLRVRYVDGRGTDTEREVEPQYLLLNHPAWYVLVFDRGRGAGRSLRLDRIQRADVEAETFRDRAASSLLAEVDTFFRGV